MKRLLALASCLVAIVSWPASAQTVTTPATAAMVCANNTIVPPPVSGQFFYVQCDANGKLITSASTNVLSAPGTVGDAVVVGPGTSGVQDGGSTGTLNVTAPAYGAKCDIIATQNDGTIANGSNQFTSAAITFAASDIGKFIVINGAGASGVPLATTITNVSGHTATLAANASTAVPALQIGGAIVVTSQSGSGSYAANDTITLTGGTETVNAILTVKNTQVASVVVNAAGTFSGVNGNIVVTGTTGTGIKFQANVAVTTASGITAINSITVPGAYTVNPTSLSAEPVTGTGLSGATLTLKMGVLTPNVTTFGTYTVLPSNPTSQGSTSGVGTGATFTAVGTLQQYWYYGSDDATAINAALSAAVKIGAGINAVVFPGASCGVASQITMLGNDPLLSPISIRGAGQNATRIYALASMTNLIERPQGNYSTGGGIRDISFNGFKLATNVINIHGGQGFVLDNVQSLNARTVECLLGDGSGVGGGYHIDRSDCHTDYQYFPKSAQSTYNLELSATGDNFITNSSFYNAATANILNNGGANHYVSNHTYGFPNPDYYAVDGILDSSGGAIIHAHEFDGATTALAALNGSQTTIVGSTFNWANNTVFAANGIVVASGQIVSIVGSIWFNQWAIIPANAIVQSGTIGGGSSFVANGLASQPADYEPAFAPTGSACPSGANWFYLAAVNTLALCNNGNQIAQWAGQFIYLGHITANGNLQAQLQNTSGGSSGQTELDVGNVTANALSIVVKGSGNSTGNGASSATITGATSLWLQGGTTNGFELDASGNPYLPSLANSTAAKTGTVCWATGAGALTYDNTSTCLVSSKRFKKNIKPLKDSLTVIAALNPVQFEYKDQKTSPGLHVGFTAENVAAVDPRFAAFDDEGKPLKVRYIEMVALLTQAMQEQQREIIRLEHRQPASHYNRRKPK